MLDADDNARIRELRVDEGIVACNPQVTAERTLEKGKARDSVCEHHVDVAVMERFRNILVFRICLDHDAGFSIVSHEALMLKAVLHDANDETLRILFNKRNKRRMVRNEEGNGSEANVRKGKGAHALGG